jgi:hypothetical protein
VPPKKCKFAGYQWMPVILATQEAEIRRISAGSQPGQIVHEILAQTNKKVTTKKKTRNINIID